MKNLFFIILFFLISPIFGQNNPNPVRNNPFAAPPGPKEQVTYINPVIPGFYSDPSVCRVGDDYYLITSTFEYFPGVPVFHSKDLVNWEQIGYCLDRKEQIPNGINIFAATIRYHERKFYMITTNVVGGGNFYVTATNPAGPWSNPIWLKEVPGIDPDLFWDENGKAYVISSPFQLFEIDLETGKLLTEGKKIWNGTGGRYSEGPHLYKKDGFYYLMAAEGGTEEAHSETIARSHNIWGPYTDNPANPILAHANAAGQESSIQGVGHADIIQAHDNSWWIVFHGYRTISYPVHHLLGRETCLAPVSWPKNGWPVVNGNGVVFDKMTCPTLPLKPFTEKSPRINFDNEKPDLQWNYIQFPDINNYSLSERPGYLRLKGSEKTITTNNSSTFIGKRITDLNFTTETKLEFNPSSENEEAGIILLNNGTHFDLVITKNKSKRVLIVKLKFGSITYKSGPVVLKPGPVNLQIEGNKNMYSFFYSQGNEEFKKVDQVETRYLSTETVGGFTGTYVGLYATGNGKVSEANADYDWFEYIAND